MAYSAESVMAKMSALNETQESIVTVAQWLMFYRQCAEQTATIWMEKLESSNYSKRLNLMYLANEIMQQAKGRNKPEFVKAFGERAANAMSLAYKGSPQEVQQKLRRVVDVWRQRRILDEQLQKDTEAKIDGLDKTRTARANLGGQLFGSSSVPTEFQPLVTQHAAVSKAEALTRPLVEKADSAIDAHETSDAPMPTPPVQIGQLNALMRTLANAESAVNQGIQARTELVAGLEKLLETNKAALQAEQETSAKFASRRADLDTKRKQLEDVITKTVSQYDAPVHSSADGTPGNASDVSPEIEGFTPPPADVEYPSADANNDATAIDEPNSGPVANGHGLTHDSPANKALDILASLQLPTVHTTMTNTLVTPAATTDSDPRKKRKTSHSTTELEEQMFAGGDGIGLDAEVAANLGAA